MNQITNSNNDTPSINDLAALDPAITSHNSAQQPAPQSSSSEGVERVEPHSQAGQLLKSIIYGGLDGATAVIIILLSGLASGATAKSVFQLALACVFGDAIGMGLGDYLSAKAEIEYIENQKVKKEEKYDNQLSEEKEKLIEILSAEEEGTNPQNGQDLVRPRYNKEDAYRVAELIATCKKAMVNILMMEELGLVAGDVVTARKCGLATFLSFIIFGIIPTIPYIISWGMLKTQTHPWVAVICLGCIELFSLGAAKAAMVGLSKWKSGLQTLLIGAGICAAGYGLGFAFPS